MLLLPALFLLLQSLNYGFVSDDFYLVYRQETEGFFSSWGGEQGNTFFRPVTVFTYASDNLLWGLNPAGYHLTNILWHLLCSVIVYLLALELFRDGTRAFLTGYLFMLLACHSESVAWISGRTDLIATAFALLSILFFIRRSFLAVPLFVFGLLAKESVITVPVIWFLLAVYLGTWKERQERILLLSGLGIWTLYTGGRLLFSPGFSNGLDSAGISLQSLPELTGNLVRYLFRVFAPPLPLSIRSFVLSNAALVPAFLASVFAAMWVLYRKRCAESGKQILLFAGCFLVSLLPVIFMKVSLFDSRSERFLYLPGVFASLMLVKWMYSVIAARRIAAIVLILFSLLQGVFLYRSFRNWQIAGEMCREIVSSGSVEIPDNYKGAYVFRNGYEEAVLIFSN